METSSRVDVKFRTGTAVERPEALLPEALRASVARIDPLVTLRGQQLDRVDAERMRRWFRMVLREGADAEGFVAALRRLDVVEAAEVAPRPAPPP